MYPIQTPESLCSLYWATPVEHAPEALARVLMLPVTLVRAYLAKYAAGKLPSLPATMQAMLDDLNG